MTDTAEKLLREAMEIVSVEHRHWMRHDASLPVACTQCALAERIRAHLATPAQPAASVGDGWLPMLTAPLDGTEIELMIRHHTYWTALKVNKHEAETQWQGVYKGKWIDHNGGGWTWHGLAGTQVAWRPLPAPPTPAASGRDEGEW